MNYRLDRGPQNPDPAEVHAGGSGSRRFRLLAGLTPARIAQYRQVSLSTVRTQIRALLEVSGTRRVAQWIVLLARSL